MTPKESRRAYEASKLGKATRKLYRQSPAGREAACKASQAYRDRQRAAKAQQQARPKPGDVIRDPNGRVIARILEGGIIQALACPEPGTGPNGE